MGLEVASAVALLEGESLFQSKGACAVELLVLCKLVLDFEDHSTLAEVLLVLVKDRAVVSVHDKRPIPQVCFAALALMSSPFNIGVRRSRSR